MAQVAPELLEWPSRATLILAEIEDADADIVTLQELNHYGASSTRAQDTVVTSKKGSWLLTVEEFLSLHLHN